MPERAPTEVGGRSEEEQARLNWQLQELLGELRVALPGVQVLFAFLLAVPFAQGFGDVTAFQEKVFFATLLCAAAASAFLIAPTALHRLRFGHGQKPLLIRVANRLAITGLAFLALAIVGAVMLVSDYLFGVAVTVVVSALVAILFAALWFMLPVTVWSRPGAD
jgi:hypothetical protein